MTLSLPKLRTDQRDIVTFARGNAATTAVVAMGRRWGKSTMAGVFVTLAAARGWRVAWVVPTYKNGRPLWRFIEQHTWPLVADRQARLNKSDRTLDMVGGGFLGIYSADSPASILGEAFHLVVIDEAARVPVEVWTDAIQPTLADYGGKSLLISTPKGRNWFYDEWLRGQSGDPAVRSFQAPSSDNPNPRIQRAAELARSRVPDATYRQEWLAEFVEDELTLFTLADIAAAEQGAVGAQPAAFQHSYVTSVDLGRRHDATVINTFDTTALPYQRVAFERLDRVSYPIIQRQIEQRAAHYPGRVIVESNGIGDPVIENLRIAAEPFVTTARSKVQALQGLQMLLEQGMLKARWTPRERAALISCSWEDDHTADEIMSLAIGATLLAAPSAGWKADQLGALAGKKAV